MNYEDINESFRENLIQELRMRIPSTKHLFYLSDKVSFFQPEQLRSLYEWLKGEDTPFYFVGKSSTGPALPPGFTGEAPPDHLGRIYVYENGKRIKKKQESEEKLGKPKMGGGKGKGQDRGNLFTLDDLREGPKAELIQKLSEQGIEDEQLTALAKKIASFSPEQIKEIQAVVALKKEGQDKGEVERTPANATDEHSYASTQLQPPPDILTRVLEYGRTISRKDLAEEGRKLHPHVTVLYGLECQAADVKAAIRDTGFVHMVLGKTSLFEGGDADVLKIEVGGDDIFHLHKLLEELPHVDTHPVYNPHMTVAYLKPGTGKKYAGNDFLNEEEMVVDSLQFSDPNHKIVNFHLGDGVHIDELASPDMEGKANTPPGGNPGGLPPGFSGLAPPDLLGRVYYWENGIRKKKVQMGTQPPKSGGGGGGVSGPASKLESKPQGGEQKEAEKQILPAQEKEQLTSGLESALQEKVGGQEAAPLVEKVKMMSDEQLIKVQDAVSEADTKVLAAETEPEKDVGPSEAEKQKTVEQAKEYVEKHNTGEAESAERAGKLNDYIDTVPHLAEYVNRFNTEYTQDKAKREDAVKRGYHVEHPQEALRDVKEWVDTARENPELFERLKEPGFNPKKDLETLKDAKLLPKNIPVKDPQKFLDTLHGKRTGKPLKETKIKLPKKNNPLPPDPGDHAFFKDPEGKVIETARVHEWKDAGDSWEVSYDLKNNPEVSEEFEEAYKTGNDQNFIPKALSNVSHQNMEERLEEHANRQSPEWRKMRQRGEEDRRNQRPHGTSGGLVKGTHEEQMEKNESSIYNHHRTVRNKLEESHPLIHAAIKHDPQRTSSGSNAMTEALHQGTLSQWIKENREKSGLKQARLHEIAEEVFGRHFPEGELPEVSLSKFKERAKEHGVLDEVLDLINPEHEDYQMEKKQHDLIKNGDLTGFPKLEEFPELWQEIQAAKTGRDYRNIEARLERKSYLDKEGKYHHELGREIRGFINERAALGVNSRTESPLRYYKERMQAEAAKNEIPQAEGATPEEVDMASTQEQAQPSTAEAPKQHTVKVDKSLPQHVQDHLHKSVVKALKTAKNLTPEQKVEYFNNVQNSLKGMSDAGHEAYIANTKEVQFFSDTDELTAAVKVLIPVLQRNLCGGFLYTKKSPQGILFLDGGKSKKGQLGAMKGGSPLEGLGKSLTSHQTTSHEIAHAMDGPKRVISQSKEWQEAWQAEIADGNLTHYASDIRPDKNESMAEGWAELGRAIMGGAVPMDVIKAQFPKCYAVAQKYYKEEDIAAAEELEEPGTTEGLETPELKPEGDFESGFELNPAEAESDLQVDAAEAATTDEEEFYDPKTGEVIEGKSPQPGITVRNVEEAGAQRKKMSEGKLSHIGDKIGTGVYGARLATMDNGEQGVWKTKSAEVSAGEVRPYGVAKDSYKKEATVSNIADHLDLWDLVPTTVNTSHEGDEGSFQKFVEGAAVGGKFSEDKAYDGPKDLARSAALDFLTMNTDRHMGNWMLSNPEEGSSNPKLVLIDNGLSFPETHDKLIPGNYLLMKRAAEMPVPKELAQWKGKRKDVEKSLKSSGLNKNQIKLGMQRFDMLVKAATEGQTFTDMYRGSGMRTMDHPLAGIRDIKKTGLLDWEKEHASKVFGKKFVEKMDPSSVSHFLEYVVDMLDEVGGDYGGKDWSKLKELGDQKKLVKDFEIYMRERQRSEKAAEKNRAKPDKDIDIRVNEMESHEPTNPDNDLMWD